MVSRRLQLAVAAAAVVAAAALAFLLAAPPERLVDYLSDDAFYYLGVARHLARGDGPTFDGLTRTTGFHPLYALVLAGLDRALRPGPRAAIALALATNAAAYVAAAWLLALAGTRLWGRRGGWLAALAWLTNPHALLLPFTGMEGTVCAAAFAGLLAALAVPAAAGTVAVALALCILARTDGLLLAPLVGATLALTGSPGSPRGILTALAAAAPYAAWLLYTHAQGASAVHGSADVKRLWRGERTEGLDALGVAWFSLRLLLTWSAKCLVKAPLLHWLLPAVAGTFRGLTRPRVAVLHLAWLFPAALGIAYALLLPRAWTWYYAPAVAGLTLLSAGALATTTLSPRWRAALVALALVESYGYLGHVLVRGRNREQRDMLEAARWVAGHVPPGTRVGAWNAGIYSWFGGHTVVNLDGLINDEVGAWIRAGRPFVGYLDGRGIDVVVDFDGLLRQLPPARLEVLARFPSRFGGKPISVVRLTPPPPD
jgi:hypothetical protein